eukprot:COSAG02_NODE_1049_length_14975_cov_29.908914_6_plen_276_part_00
MEKWAARADSETVHLAVQVHKKPGAKKVVAESDELRVHQRRPAYRVKPKDDVAGKSTGITKAMTQALGENREAVKPTQELNDVAEIELESESDAGESSDESLEDLGGVDAVPIDNARPMDPGADGSWVLTRVAKKGGVSWRLLPNQHRSLATLHQSSSEEDASDEDEVDDDANDQEDEEEANGSDVSGGSASSGAVVKISAVRARISALALKAEASGKVEIGPKGIKPRRIAANERHGQNQRQHHQKRSLNLTGKSALVRGSSSTTWKLGRKLEV